MAVKTTLDKTLRRFRAQKVMTLAELAVQMQCSQRTVHRRLKDWDAINSYNKNGRYYVLPSVPRFDSHGLWRYGDIGFCRYGNLTETVIHLVRNSAAGLSAAELGQLLQMDPRSFLWLFRNHPALKRQRHQGRFVYFAAESAIYRRQKDGRLTMAADVRRPTDSEIIAILVEAIKHPDLSVEQLCRHLKKQGVEVTEPAVSNLFAYHRLDVKKTERSR
jgi:arginine repressor